ncbi:unnamed protein product [Effrenium voratum]|nr:unnamed protein product [Effrenium voratum]
MPLLDTPPPWSTDATHSKHSEAMGDEPWIYKGTGVSLIGEGLASADGLLAMRRAVDQLESFWPHMPSDADLRWAGASVQSRAHSASQGGTVLIPIADCFNHSPSNANCEVIQHSDAIEVVTQYDIEAGEELLICYGHFSNAELLFNAGFTCWPNEHDCLVVLPAEFLAAVEEERHSQGRGSADLKGRLSCLSARPACLRAAMPLLGCGIPAKTVTLLSGLLLDEERWQQLMENGGPGSLHDAWAEAGELQAEALAVVLRALKGIAISRYQTPLECDEKADSAKHVRSLCGVQRAKQEMQSELCAASMRCECDWPNAERCNACKLLFKLDRTQPADMEDMGSAGDRLRA